MSSPDSAASGAVVFHLAEELRAIEHAGAAPNGRSARTLSAAETLRVTLMRLDRGSKVPPHQSKGPVTVQVMNGAVTLHIADLPHQLGEGDLATFDGGLMHALESLDGATLLVAMGRATT